MVATTPAEISSFQDFPKLHRIIPCLLLHQGGLVKTTKFKDPVYVGDPINAVKIFNEKCADELILVDIDATVEGRGPDIEFLRGICAQAFMPVCYGGGVKSVQQMEELFQAGVEKVSVSAAALENPDLIGEAVSHFGSQSVIVTIDVRKGIFGNKRLVCTHNGKKKWEKGLLEWVKTVQDLGAGEIVINDVERDGTMRGYDFDLLKSVVDLARVPVVALGGAKEVEEMKVLIDTIGVSAAAAGSLFVFKGPHRAVLINYPERNY
jgi:imidazole glycerol-phosphate synthase subunit HisF